MSDPINDMFPSGGGMRGGPALVCVIYDSNGNPCGISGLPDFAENYVEALAAERDRLVAQLAEARAEGFRRGIEAAAQAADDWFYDPENDAVTDTRLSATIRALPLPADLREVVDMISGK